QFSRGGGMEAYMLLLIKGFLAVGDEVTIHTYEVDRQLAAQFPCAIRQIKLPPLPGHWKKYLFLQRCNANFNREEYDISLSLTRTSCQDIAICGGVHPEVVKRVSRSSLLRWFHDKIEIAFERKMFATVPIIIAHSKTIAGEIINNYEVEESKINVLYPPIDIDKFFPADLLTVKETCAEFNISANKLTFLLPSCGHKCKGLQQLLLAFNQLDADRFELLVAGGRLPRKIPANVRYIGYIDNLAPIYSAVDFTILPSHYEAFGLVIPESLQCGTPVITTREVGAAELLSDQDGILLNNNQPETIATTIRKLSKTFPVAENFANRHRLTISQHIADIKALYPDLRPR
ncbi:MAG: glycosyltransferase family 4 protein, partial [Desulfobacteraceae bacterium]|nr:glycosyltransferase family 4 protein [Desulfobacteraceae bacterium]